MDNDEIIKKYYGLQIAPSQRDECIKMFSEIRADEKADEIRASTAKDIFEELDDWLIKTNKDCDNDCGKSGSCDKILLDIHKQDYQALKARYLKKEE